MEAPMRIIGLVGVLAASCTGSGSEAGEGGGGDGMCYPLGAPRDPSTLEACCEASPGRAHCVPTEVVPADFQEALAPCAGGGMCIPDEIIESGGLFTPRSCAATVAGSAAGPG